MRIADRHGRPLSEVLSEYPAWELSYWASWFAREPDSGHRAEIAVAQLHRSFISANSKKGHSPPKIKELLVPDWWAENNKQRAAEHDVQSLTEAFMDAGIPIKTNSRGNH